MNEDQQSDKPSAADIADGIEEYLARGQPVPVSRSSWDTIIAALRARSAVARTSPVAHPDKDADLFLCCADGEGTHEFRVCRGYDGIAAFYEEMCGRDADDTLDSLKRTFDDPEEWRNDGAALKFDLYCATFSVWKVAAAELAMPGTPPSAKEATFGAEPCIVFGCAEPAIADGVQRVRLELDRMGIRDADIVISTNLHLRLDGLPKSGQAQPADPGAAVYWRTKDGQRCMAIDQYDRVEHNLAAIAATLDAMRAIKRHGGAEILERAFTGFAALPAPMAGQKPWRAVLGFDLDYTPTSDDVQAQYRIRRSETHPDKGGSQEAFLAVQAAYEAAGRELGFTP